MSSTLRLRADVAQRLKKPLLDLTAKAHEPAPAAPPKPKPPAAKQKAAKVARAQPTPEERAAKLEATLAAQQIEHREAVKRHRAQRDAHLTEFARRWPVCFKSPTKPLAIGIDVELGREMGLTRSQTARLLSWWTSRRSYLRALTEGGPRYALDGSECGEVTDEARQTATQLLTQRFGG